MKKLLLAHLKSWYHGVSLLFKFQEEHCEVEVSTSRGVLRRSRFIGCTCGAVFYNDFKHLRSEHILKSVVGRINSRKNHGLSNGSYSSNA